MSHNFYQFFTRESIKLSTLGAWILLIFNTWNCRLSKNEIVDYEARNCQISKHEFVNYWTWILSSFKARNYWIRTIKSSITKHEFIEFYSINLMNTEKLNLRLSNHEFCQISKPETVEFWSQNLSISETRYFFISRREIFWSKKFFKAWNCQLLEHEFV